MNENDRFEARFWSGVDLRKLHDEFDGRDAVGFEAIFCAIFRAYGQHGVSVDRLERAAADAVHREKRRLDRVPRLCWLVESLARDAGVAVALVALLLGRADLAVVVGITFGNAIVAGVARETLLLRASAAVERCREFGDEAISAFVAADRQSGKSNTSRRIA